MKNNRCNKITNGNKKTQNFSFGGLHSQTLEPKLTRNQGNKPRFPRKWEPLERAKIIRGRQEFCAFGHNLYLASGRGEGDEQKFGHLLSAHVVRQMRENQFPGAFYNYFSHSFKLLFFSSYPFIKQPFNNLRCFSSLNTKPDVKIITHCPKDGCDYKKKSPCLVMSTRKACGRKSIHREWKM
jgi:hypothetical protein